MSRRDTVPGQVIGFKVESHKQEEDLSWLAIQLAEALNGASAHDRDYRTFIESSMAERQKALALQAVVFQLEERARSGAPPKPSRMDPLNTYDLETCKEEFKTLKERAVELQQIAMEHSVQSTKLNADATALQLKIRKIRSQKS